MTITATQRNIRAKLPLFTRCKVTYLLKVLSFINIGNSGYFEGSIRLWEVSSGPEPVELLVVMVESSTSGSGSLWERSPVGSRLSKSLFWDVAGTIPESVRVCQENFV